MNERHIDYDKEELADYIMKRAGMKDPHTPYLSPLLENLHNSDQKIIEISKPVSQGPTFIGADIHKNTRIYCFANFKAVHDFMKDRVDPDINCIDYNSGPLGISYALFYDFETLAEYKGFLTEC